MVGGEAVLFLCRIDSSSRLAYQFSVFEILMETAFVGIQKTSSADLSQGNDMRIVGYT